jgi:nitrous oxidase accessory protein NosD
LITYNRIRGWDLQNWRRVWFNDESRFMLQPRDGCIRVYRRRNARFARNCVLEVDNFGGGSVMMWGAYYTQIIKNKLYAIFFGGTLMTQRSEKNDISWDFRGGQLFRGIFLK